MKVFVSGSKTIGKLNDDIQNKLKELADTDCEILIGDCYGVDVAVQKFYAEIGYERVTVYVSGEKVRNNVGNNEVVHIPVPEGVTGYELYKQKDIAMANEADIGLVIWDGKTKGTQNNIEELRKLSKQVIVYKTENFKGDEKINDD